MGKITIWLLRYAEVFIKVPATPSPSNYKWPDDKLPSLRISLGSLT